MPAVDGTSRVWTVRASGDPSDVLGLEEREIPMAGPNEVLIEVDAIGLSFPDLLQCKGEYQSRKEHPFIPGSEAVGRIIDVGPEVDTKIVGARVASLQGGALAEHVVRRVDGLLPVPDSLSSTKAAALLINYGTAWWALHERARLRKDEWLLVLSGSGGVGSAAVQVGLAHGARVIATAGGTEKVSVLRSLGAEIVVDHEDQDVAAAVNDATKGHGVDVALDPVGGELFNAARRAMAWEGRLLVVGFASGTIPELRINHPLLRGYSVVGVNFGGSASRDSTLHDRVHDQVLLLHEKGLIDPLIHSELPFEEVPRGFELLAARATYGKVTIRTNQERQ
jgi:NADPH2:quinone reductase